MTSLLLLMVACSWRCSGRIALIREQDLVEQLYVHVNLLHKLLELLVDEWIELSSQLVPDDFLVKS